MVKLPESLLNQKAKWKYQLKVQDHFQAQVQFWEKDNLPKCQGGFQDFRQVQMDVMKLNLDFCPEKECEWVKWSSQVQERWESKLAQERHLFQVTLQESILIQGMDSSR